MPATTASQLAPMLSSYVEPGGDFKNSLNQVIARMYHMGTYRDLTVQYSLPVSNGCVTLPEDADSVLHTMVNGMPAPVRALWHDYKTAGLNYTGSGPAWGLVDAGYWPTLVDLSASATTFYIVPAAASTTKRAFGDDGSVINAVASDATNHYSSTTNYTAKTLVFSSAVNVFTNISFDGLTDRYDIRTVAADPTTTIATVGPDSGITRYRRFRISNPQDTSTTCHVLCKRAFQPIVNDGDIVYISNIGALKHGMLGRLAEDNADIERADYHWGKCMLLLEEEMASSRGAAIPRLNIDPYGTGNMSRMRTLL